MSDDKSQVHKEMLNMGILTADLQRYYSTLGGKVIWALLPIVIFSIVCLIKFGNKNDYLLLLFGSIFSLLGMMCYIMASLKWGIKNKKGLVPMFLAIGGLFPWIFSLYLVLPRGLVVLFDIRGNFSFSSLFLSLSFMYLGYILASANYKIVIAEKRMMAGWNSIRTKC